MIVKIVATIVYLGICAYLGVLGYQHTKNSSDYLVGGRKVHPMIMALSYGSTFISTSAIVGFGGNAGVFGLSLLWLTFLNIFLGIFVAFVFFGKRTRRIGHNINAHTLPEFLGERFQSNFIKRFAGTVIFIFMPIYAAAVMIGASKFLEGGLGINYNVSLFIFAAIVAAYVFFGGLKGVMYSDAFQGIVMFLGMLMLIIAVYSKLGGITEAHQKLTDLMNNPTVKEQTANIAAGGFQGWTAMPKFGSQYWWVIMSTIVMGVGIGVLAQPQLAVRFMTVKSDREINRAIPIGGVFILMMTGVAFVVGALSNVLFFESTGSIAVAAAGGTDSIIPAVINSFMPEWFVTVFLIILLAAGMSTLSSQFHVIGAAVGRDIFGKKSDDAGRTMTMSRIGMLVAIVVTIVLAYALPSIWDGAIAISTSLFFGLCCASFLPMYVGALYIRKMTKAAALSGMLTGACVSLLWMMFVHSKESVVLKVCQLIFGKPSLADGSLLAVVDPIIVSLSASILVTIIVQLCTKSKYSEEHINKCFEGIKA